jgi:hypothetical protein
MYSQKAFEILSSSINSAIFIDEKAKDFYSTKSIDDSIPEERLSVNLYNTFKSNGKSLAVHKFEIENLEDKYTLKYLFSGRDLILLDWELAEHAGQQYSLRLLSEAVKTPNVNFCCIYSNSGNFNSIPLFLDAYFSGLTKEDLEKIKDTYDHIEIEDIEGIWAANEAQINEFVDANHIVIDEFPIESCRIKSKQIILKYIYISLNVDKFIIPEPCISEFEVLNVGSDSFNINNTFVLTLKKDYNIDTKYDVLLKRISDNIIKNDGSFFQLLGMEMQSIFNNNERFIDETILKSSTEALFQFRDHLKDDKIFGTIIKKLLLEQAALKLRTAKLELLKPELLDAKSKELEGKEPTNEDLFQLNVFYNSVTVRSLNQEDIPNLNFGDVFKDEKNKNYYLCITALCDCYYPDKISNNFYFAKGVEFEDLDLALKLGDTAFLSFLPNGKAVYWGEIEKPRIKKIKNKALSDTEDNIEELKKDIEEQKKQLETLIHNNAILNSFLYKPFYIKPKIFYVENNKIIGNKINIWDITNKTPKGVRDHTLNDYIITYITTLRSDYTQRIANHAFGHPGRVGVDFVSNK